MRRLPPPLTIARLGLAAALILGSGAASRGQDEFRSLDGSGNNPLEPLAGSVGMPLLRRSPYAYGDGIDSPAGAARPGARAVSNAVVAQARPRANRRGLSDMFWLWGQFLDHDVSLTGPAVPVEPFDIEVPRGDPWFDPDGAGGRVIFFNRSAYVHETAARAGSRRQINEISAYVDASQVYGCDPVRATTLRAPGGELRTSRGALLPFNEESLDNAGGDLASLYLAGDIRANENVALLAMHTLWVREHNRQARRIRAHNPGMHDDEVYERARAAVGALVQSITYNEFLPLLMGDGALGPYRGWDPSVGAGVAQEFSTAAYRFGHSMVSARLLRLRRNGRPIREGHLPIERAFFAPHELTPAIGIEPYLRGLATQRAQELDTRIVDPLRNVLFGPPGAGGFDLAALNIQRGRDHGLADFNTVRRAYGLPPLKGLRELSPNRFVVQEIRRQYGTIDDLDLWVGGLAEAPVRGAVVGPTFHAILVDQFRRLRDSDRFYYARVFAGRDLEQIEGTRLADVIRRNTRIGAELQDEVFLAAAGR